MATVGFSTSNRNCVDCRHVVGGAKRLQALLLHAWLAVQDSRLSSRAQLHPVNVLIESWPLHHDNLEPTMSAAMSKAEAGPDAC